MTDHTPHHYPPHEDATEELTSESLLEELHDAAKAVLDLSDVGHSLGQRIETFTHLKEIVEKVHDHLEPPKPDRASRR